jgi:hypothetical protein
MAEYVSNTITQLLTDLADARVGRPAVRTVVASIFHQSDFRSGGSQGVVEVRIDGAVQAIIHGRN